MVKDDPRKKQKVADEITGMAVANAAAAPTEEELRAQYPVTQAYDKTTDYMAQMAEAANQGDYAKAARYEQQRNSKITGEGLDTGLYTDLYSGYLPEKRYTYDPAQNEQYTAAKAQQDALYEKLMNRGSFSWNEMSDPLYRQYRERYTQLGQQSMRDTMGQAAALTGGYGSTYAQQAGQQSYDAYMQRLNDVMPELYSAAYGRWQDEGNALQNQYTLAAAQADQAYQRGYNDWSTRLGLEREDEANAYARRLAEEQSAYQRQQDSRSYLLNLISSTGYTPTDAELQAAGMTRGEANALKAAYEKALAAASFSSGGGSGRSGGSGRRSSGGNNNGNWAADVTEQDSATAQQQATLKNQCSISLANMAKYGGSKQEMRRELQRWVAQGLDETTASQLAKQYGLDKDDTAGSSGGGKGGSGGSGGGKTYTKGEY